MHVSIQMCVSKRKNCHMAICLGSSWFLLLKLARNGKYLHVFVLRLFQCNQGLWNDAGKVISCFSLAFSPPKPDRLHSEVDCSISALWFNLPFPRPQASVLDLKEHASSLASSGLKKDSKLKSLEIALEQKKEECTKLENQLKKVSQTLGWNWSSTASKYSKSRQLSSQEHVTSHYGDWHVVRATLTTLKTMTMSWMFAQVHFSPSSAVGKILAQFQTLASSLAVHGQQRPLPSTTAFLMNQNIVLDWLLTL